MLAPQFLHVIPIDPVVVLDPIEPIGIEPIPPCGIAEEPIEGPLPKKALTCGRVRSYNISMETISPKTLPTDPNTIDTMPKTMLRILPIIARVQAQPFPPKNPIP